jgi:RNA polymerase sigma factor (sigma-70 family)
VARHDEEHLRRFVAARGRGAEAEMRRWWEELVVDFRDRIDGFVATEHRGRLSDDEHQIAVQLCLIRFAERLIETFEGVSIGELVNACRTMAKGICIDVQRRAQRERRHVAASLDDARDAAEQARPAWEAATAKRRHDDEQAAADARGFVEWALPQVKEEYRRVLELTIEGAATDEIMEALNISRENAYQRRTRGLRELARLKEQYDR